MIPDFSKTLTRDEALGPAMEITDEGEAQAYLEAYVAACAQDGIEREKALALARDNLGYYAGYYGIEVQRRVERLFGAIHPFFGPTCISYTPEETVRLGMDLAESLFAAPRRKLSAEEYEKIRRETEEALRDVDLSDDY
jgi:hypothetical protein